MDKQRSSEFHYQGDSVWNGNCRGCDFPKELKDERLSESQQLDGTGKVRELTARKATCLFQDR